MAEKDENPKGSNFGKEMLKLLFLIIALGALMFVVKAFL
jgi:hypothetical protein